jgi:UDP-N-acetylmuramoylalanine--D-glutamate ligase
MELAGKRVLVVGLAQSGMAACALLAGRGAQVLASDAKPFGQLLSLQGKLLELGVTLTSPEIALRAGLDLVVLSPGVPVDSAVPTRAIELGIPVIGEVELAAHFLRGPIIGITGTNGKTTTTALTHHLLVTAGLPALLGGNIGVPPTALVDDSREDQYLVLELSSFQLETAEHLRARIGACLNVTPDHLDRHGSMERYAAAKRRLFETQDGDCLAVLNADDEWTAGFAEATPAAVVWFSPRGRREPGFWVEGGWIRSSEGDLLALGDVPLPGTHNLENIMCAAACARLAGVPPGEIAAGVRTFRGVEHRLEFARELKGVRYYNDSKATNVDAALKAVESFGSGLWMILGGKDKGSDYRPLRDPLARRAKAALLIGAAAQKIADHLEGSVPLVACGTMEEAVKHAHSRAKSGDTVLLAPACASFDQFENYEHRGRVFKELVLTLPEGDDHGRRD